MKFKVLKGKHDHYDITYCEGEIVETEMDLEVIFPNKFERVDREVPPATVKPAVDEVDEDEVVDEVDEDDVEDTDNEEAEEEEEN